MKMQEPDAKMLARRAEIIAALREIVPGEGVIATQAGLRAYECDAFTAYRALPMVVVLPDTVAQVSAVLAYCH
ncbi:MAG TPA: FAD-binding oxidoreductase, partial [Beijerinckia sp.]|nr:FAD-binding oxidoreductase [Beijerinckia sp.]